MITDSLNLHNIEEENLIRVGSDEVIDENEVNQKIKLTYTQAIEEIYKLKDEVEHKKYFNKLLKIDDELGNPILLGAAVDKTLGDVYVIVKNQRNSDASVIKKTLNGEWKRIDAYLKDRGIYQIRRDPEIDLGRKIYENGLSHFSMAYFYENDYRENNDLLDSSASYFSREKSFCPINAPLINEIIKEKFRLNFAPNCYTINYKDIVNRFDDNVERISSVKNARSVI